VTSSVLPPARSSHHAGAFVLCAALLGIATVLGLERSQDRPRSSPPSPAGADYDEAVRLYVVGHFQEALEAINRASATDGWSAALRALAGWCHLRAGALAAAEAEFRAALKLDAGAVDPHVGLGYVLLRRGSSTEAEDQFHFALRREASNLDAQKGLGLALRDQKKYSDATQAFRDALRLKPGDAEAEGLLQQALAAGDGGREERPRGPATGTAIRVVAQARDGRFFVREGGRFRPLFVKGVNMGVALPGRFPAEFPPDEATYRSFLSAIAGMGANAVRLYTLLPPSFYAALRRHNDAARSAPLWLLQGIWTEPPAGDDYDGDVFVREFRGEIRRVIDAVHGNLDLEARPGHASGMYRADISPHVLGYILGREWEPLSVRTYDGWFAKGHRESFAGAYFTARLEDGATPFEQWLARTMDFAVEYETGNYRQQRPISFVNWPTLDPLRHPTESTAPEEGAFLRAMGEEETAEMIEEYSECEDCVGVDAARIVPTPDARGGIFATYHAYPYYPDFMNLDPGYSRARDSKGPSNFIGYLRDLKTHHGAQPVLIGETGVPSSRGIAHLQPQGWNHGGHTERAQGEIDARLMMDIDEAGLAGGVLFALLDEWFKRNWMVFDFEVPAERKPLWLNVLDPEENYGLLAARPGATSWKVKVDGRAEDWNGVAPLVTRPEGGPERPFKDGYDRARTLRGLAVTSDEAYLYIRLDVDRLDADGDGAPDWGKVAYLIGIDTYDARRGDHRLPITDKAVSPAGLEFCLVLDGAATSRLLVDTPYDLQTKRHHRPYGSVENADGRFMEIKVETNRRRVGRDGTVYPAQQSSRSQLIHGSMDRRDRDSSTLTDWAARTDSNTIEIRLGWGLLNVTDPSSRSVLSDDPDNLKNVGCTRTAGFRFYAAAIKPEGAAGGRTPIEARLADRLPPGDLAQPSDLPMYAWRGWDEPTYHIEKKEGWNILKRAFEALPAHREAP